MKLLLRERQHILPLQKCIAGDDVKNLSDTELLSIILGTGTKKNDVTEISLKIITQLGGLRGILNSGIREITKITGIGIKKAIRIHSAFELGRRVITDNDKNKKIDSPLCVRELLLPDFAGLENEIFIVLIINNKNFLLKKKIISMGTISETIVHPREVFRDAIREGGSSIIISHNHPSGITTPSKEDIKTTRRISEAGKIIGIPLLDHVIITNSSYLSMKENGNL